MIVVEAEDIAKLIKFSFFQSSSDLRYNNANGWQILSIFYAPANIMSVIGDRSIQRNFIRHQSIVPSFLEDLNQTKV